MADDAAIPPESRTPEDWAPETCFRLYDEAMVGWLREVMTCRGAKPTVKAGWGSRFFEEVPEIHGNVNLGAKQAIPLPMVVLSETGVAPDHGRWTRSDIRAVAGGPTSPTNTIYHGTEKKVVLHLPAPQPIDISYQIDIRAKTMQDLRFLRTALLTQFRFSPVETFLRVPFPDPWGEKIIPLRWERDDNTSNLEAGETERELRRTVSVVLKAWILKAPIARKTILNAHIAVVDGDPQDEGLVTYYSNGDNYNFNADKTILASVTESPDYSPPNRVIATISFASGVLSAVDGNPV